jgi:hypothetical protein
MLSQGEEISIPAIDATVYSLLVGNVLFKSEFLSEFLAVNKKNIILTANHLLATP